jgi:hypothetical protein
VRATRRPGKGKLGEQGEPRTHTRLGLPLDPYEPIPDGYWDRVKQAWPNGARLTAAWEMAADLDTLRDLLNGLPVDVSRLRPEGYRLARQTRQVTLSRPVDGFDVKDAA